jgi:hypothetical protein
MADVLTDKAQILARMAESRRALQSALDRAGHDLIERPGTWGEWTLKDLLAHIVYWQTVAIDRLQKVADGRRDEIRLTGSDAEIDEANENVYRANKDRPLTEMLDIFHSTYRSLRTAVKSLPADLFREQQPEGTFSVPRAVHGDGYGHEEEHLADVENAIQRSKT